jgi:hypothetical protein
MRPHGRGTNARKEKNLFFLVVACWKKKRKKMFGFQFSIPKIPKIPKLPELCRLRGQSREKKKVFSA